MAAWLKMGQTGLLAYLLSLGLVMSCTSNPNEVKQIETKMEVKGKTQDGEVGIDKEGDAIIQDKVDADDELRRQQWVNNRLEDELSTEHYELKRCRRDIADQRLGGDGTVNEIPEVDNMKSSNQIKEDFGLDESGELRVVKKQYYLEKLKTERKYESTLREMKKMVVKHREDCERKMSAARITHGLPGARFKAEGYFQGDGTWVEKRKAENNLDDAFEIVRRESKASN